MRDRRPPRGIWRIRKALKEEEKGERKKSEGLILTDPLSSRVSFENREPLRRDHCLCLRLLQGESNAPLPDFPPW